MNSTKLPLEEHVPHAVRSRPRPKTKPARMGFGKSEPTRCEEQVEHSCNTRAAELAAGRVRQRQCVWRRFCRASGRGNQGAPLAAGGGSCRSRHLAKGAVVSHHPRGSSVAATAPESESAPPYENPRDTSLVLSRSSLRNNQHITGGTWKTTK